MLRHRGNAVSTHFPGPRASSWDLRSSWHCARGTVAKWESEQRRPALGGDQGDREVAWGQLRLCNAPQRGSCFCHPRRAGGAPRGRVEPSRFLTPARPGKAGAEPALPQPPPSSCGRLTCAPVHLGSVTAEIRTPLPLVLTPPELGREGLKHPGAKAPARGGTQALPADRDPPPPRARAHRLTVPWAPTPRALAVMGGRTDGHGLLNLGCPRLRRDLGTRKETEARLRGSRLSSQHSGG